MEKRAFKGRSRFHIYPTWKILISLSSFLCLSPSFLSLSLLLVGVSTVSPTLRGVLSSIGIARAEQETGIPTAPFHVAMPRKHVREMISGLAGVLSPSRYDDRSSRDIPSVHSRSLIKRSLFLSFSSRGTARLY